MKKVACGLVVTLILTTLLSVTGFADSAITLPQDAAIANTQPAPNPAPVAPVYPPEGETSVFSWSHILCPHSITSSKTRKDFSLFKAPQFWLLHSRRMPCHVPRTGWLADIQATALRFAFGRSHRYSSWARPRCADAWVRR